MTPKSSPLVLNTPPPCQHGPLISDRVEHLLRKEIELRRNEPNAQLKHEMDLAEQFNVSCKTIRSAMNRLKKEGLIYAIRGKGTFIRSQKRTNITLITQHQHHPCNMMAISVMTSLLRQQGYNANLIISNNLQQDWADIENEQSTCMGVVLIGDFRDQDLLWLAKNVKTPFVLLGDSDAAIRTPTQYNHVLPNNRDLAFRAADYLLARGHTKIGFLTWGEQDTFAYVKESNDGFVTALHKRGLKPNPAWSIALPFVNFSEGQQNPNLSPFSKAQRKLDDWFNNDNAPTALLITSASELQIRDILESCCRNHFAIESVVAITLYEQLRISYNGMGKITAACCHFEYLAKRALALLVQPQQSPFIREVCDQSAIYLRENGVWKIADSVNTVSHVDEHSAQFATSDTL